MPLHVASFSTYLTRVDGPWNPDDYNARDFIYAVKDRDITKYAWVRVRGKWQKFTNDNRQDVVAWFAEMVAEYFEGNPVELPVVLVPVPGSKHDIDFQGTPRTAVLAEQIATRLDQDVSIVDVLRWIEAMPSANAQGGTREAEALFANLVVTGDVAGMRVVLIDDVLTSGGHLRACAARLREAGADVVLAICAGRADQTQATDPFAVRHDELHDYEG